MRKFAYNEYGKSEPIVLTEDQVVEYHLPALINRAKEGGIVDPVISKEECIEDFCIIHWAWEVKDVPNNED